MKSCFTVIALTLLVVWGFMGCGNEAGPGEIGDGGEDTGGQETDPDAPCTPTARLATTGGATSNREALVELTVSGCSLTDVYLRRQGALYDAATFLGKDRYRRFVTLSPGANPLTAVAFTNGGMETELGTVSFDYTPVPPAQSASSGFIVGKVLSGDLPVAGAIVYLREVPGELTTDAEGAFVFPTPGSGHFLLMVEAEGYTFAVRHVDVSAGHRQSATIRLVKRDVKTARITPEAGGTLVNSVGDVALEVPPGAVRTPFDISAVSFPVAETLPDMLPDSSRWTQAFDLSPVGIRFDKDATLRLKNALGFAPGTAAPLGSYNRDLGAWQPAGMGIVSADGQWVELTIKHFSPYDCNYPTGQNQTPGAEGDLTPDDCLRATSGASLVDELAGQLTLFVPAMWRLGDGEPAYLRLVYQSDAATGTVHRLFPYLAGQNPVAKRVEADISLEGVDRTLGLDVVKPSASYIVGARFDSLDAEGGPLPTGVYPASLTLRTLAASTYRTADAFGAPGISDTGVPTREPIPYESRRTLPVTLVNDRDAAFGAGWRFEGAERLTPSPDLNLVLWEHDGVRSTIPLGLIGNDVVEIEGGEVGEDFKRFFILDDDRVLLVGENVVRIAADIARVGAAAPIYTAPAAIIASSLGPEGLVLLDIEGMLTWLSPDGRVEKSRDVNGPLSALLLQEGRIGVMLGVSLTTHLAVDANGTVYLDLPTVGLLAATPTPSGLDLKPIFILEFPGSGRTLSGLVYDAEEPALYFSEPKYSVIQRYDIRARNESTFVSIADVTRFASNGAPFELFEAPDRSLYYVTPAGEFGRFTKRRLHSRMDGAPYSPFVASDCALQDMAFLSDGTPVVHCMNDDNSHHRFARVDLTGGRDRRTGALLRRDGADFVITLNGETRRFDAAGHLVLKQRPEGTETFAYSGGQLAAYRRGSYEATFTYEGGKLSRIADTADNLVDVEVNAEGDLARIVDGNGVASRFTYADHRMVRREVDGYALDYTWDGGGAITGALLPTGEERAYRSVFQATAPDGIAPIDAATALFIDGESDTTTVSYGNDAERSSIDFNGERWRVSQSTGFDANGVAMRKRTVSFGSDTVRYETAESIATDGGYDVTYNGESALHIRYDDVDRMTAFTAGGMNCYFYYNEDNGLLEVADCGASFYARYAYDANGVLRSVWDYNGNEWQLVLDANGNPTSVTDPEGGVTQLLRDGRGYLAQMVDPEGRTQSFEMDGFGNLIGYVDPLGAVSTFTYKRAATCPNCGEHGVDVLASITDPLGQTWGYGVRADGLRDAVVNPLGETRRYTYDRDRRLVGVAGEGSAGYAITYDARGRVATVQTGADTTQYAYDAQNRLIEARSPAMSVERSYTGFGEVTTVEEVTDLVTGISHEVTWQKRETTDVIDAFSSSVGHDYTVYGKAVLESASSNTAGLAEVDLDYDPAGGAVPSYIGIEDQGGDKAVSVSRRFDPLQRIDTSSYYAGIDDEVYDTLTYAYEGRRHWIESITASYGVLFPAVTRYTHDDVGRVTGMTGPCTEQYTYDAAGRLTGTLHAGSFGYDAAGRLLSTDLAAYTYEPRGTRLTRVDAASGERWAYTFDESEALVRVEKYAGSDTVPFSTIALTYDPLRRLSRIDVDGEVTHLMWLQHTLIAELDENGVLIRRYLPSWPADHVASFNEGGEEAYVVADRMGSVHRLLDAHGGELARYVYDAYGRVVEATGDMAPQPRRFQAMYYLDAVGLYYVRARWYDPEIGQFISEAPTVGVTPYPHPYQFAYGDPTRFYDESGYDEIGFAPDQTGAGIRGAAAKTDGPMGGVIDNTIKIDDALSGYKPGESNHNGVWGRKKIWKSVGLDRNEMLREIGESWDDFTLGKAMKVKNETERSGSVLRDCDRMRR